MTGPIDGDDFYSVDPVMYLYKIDDPHNYSYYNDDASGRGRHSQITATLPAGDYYLVIRAYSSLTLPQQQEGKDLSMFIRMVLY